MAQATGRLCRINLHHFPVSSLALVGPHVRPPRGNTGLSVGACFFQQAGFVSSSESSHSGIQGSHSGFARIIGVLIWDREGSQPDGLRIRGCHSGLLCFRGFHSGCSHIIYHRSGTGTGSSHWGFYCRADAFGGFLIVSVGPALLAHARREVRLDGDGLDPSV